MTIKPTFTRINGDGKPRILVIKATATWTSSDETAFTSTGGAAVDLPATVHAGMRARSYVVRASLPSLEVYGKILTTNTTSGDFTVAQWVGGTPTDGQIVTVDGYVIDLPYCAALVETFTPDQLIHRLWRSRKASIFYGWGYSVRLDYATWIAADTLIDMYQALNISGSDKIVLIPRVDKPGNSYNVIYDGDISIQRFGRGPGHRGVTFGFVGTENVAWPIPNQGYGFSYSYVYGTQL
jgi:hypothetical protein